ncbi:MutS protein msh5 [Aspergillus hancockii]|nr:MutS protein msh5 [Aspergillus hancockii]
MLAFAFYGIDIHDAVKETAAGNELALVNQALRVFEAAQLYRVGSMIQEIVNIDSSEEQGRTVRQVAIEIADTIPESIDIDVNVIYFPLLGFNIAVSLNDMGDAAFEGSGDDWEPIFVTENRACFKDFRMRERDEKLGNIYGLICEKEIEIVSDLAQKVLQYEKLLLEASDLLAMTQAASFYRLTLTKLTQANVINIKGGRHVLQELTVSSYVPNETLLVGGKSGAWAPSSSYQPSKSRSEFKTGHTPSMLLLTGPNLSGKGVYMKQVGSFVPAESVEMGITDNILVKSNSLDSVSQIQSTFMTELQQISFDSKQVTQRSLLIIDEFGKGTSEGELKDAPKVIAATHFHEILENKYLEPGPRSLLSHKKVQVCEESRQAEDHITYLYNFHRGRVIKATDQSLNGISQTIVDRANELASFAVRGENLAAICAMLSSEEMRALED